MKKKSLFSGISAKLALVAVALTTVVVTSCEKEEFKVEPVELPNASATVVVTVYDLETGNAISELSKTETITAGTDGTITETPKTYEASKEGYFPGSVTVTIPALAKGQYAFIPANIYLQSYLSAAKDPVVTEDPETVIKKEEPLKVTTYTNEEDKAITKELEVAVKAGQRITNLAEVKEYIAAIAPSTRAMSSAEVNQVLNALVNSYNSGVKTTTVKRSYTIPGYSILTISPKATSTTTTCTITTTIDGTAYSIPGVVIEKVGTFVPEPNTESIGHGHSHGHGHGNGGNSGGGEGGK